MDETDNLEDIEDDFIHRKDLDSVGDINLFELFS